MAGETCQATRKDGTACSLPIVAQSGFCFAHGPNRAGGRVPNSERALKRVPLELRKLLTLVLKSATEVHEGAITPQQGGAIAALTGAAIRIMQIGELETRVADLERGQTERRTA